MSHERRCYKNPITKSCASCLFLKQEHIQYTPGYSISLLTCLRNHNTPNKLETGCNDFHYKKGQCDKKVIQQIREAYNPVPFIQPYIDKYVEAHEKRMTENQESHDGQNLQNGKNIGWDMSDAPF
jgi:transcription elongation factor Elf1